MTEPTQTCSHGIRWDAECPACNLVSARELVAHWGEKIDAARKVIEAAENEGVKT